jgi:hypothetical protein
MTVLKTHFGSICDTRVPMSFVRQAGRTPNRYGQRNKTGREKDDKNVPLLAAIKKVLESVKNKNLPSLAEVYNQAGKRTLVFPPPGQTD